MTHIKGGDSLPNMTEGAVQPPHNIYLKHTPLTACKGLAHFPRPHQPRAVPGSWLKAVQCQSRPRLKPAQCNSGCTSEAKTCCPKALLPTHDTWSSKGFWHPGACRVCCRFSHSVVHNTQIPVSQATAGSHQAAGAVLSTTPLGCFHPAG